MATREGGCLCGAIRYAIDGPLGPIGNCHCETCRRAHAAAFATTSRLARSAFRWTKGEETLRSFESSPGKRRFFCPLCGSHLIAAWDHEDDVILRVGSLLSDPGAKPIINIWDRREGALVRPRSQPSRSTAWGAAQVAVRSVLTKSSDVDRSAIAFGTHEQAILVPEILMQTFALTILIIGLAMAGMAVGVIFSNRTLKGSCGGTGLDCSCSDEARRECALAGEHRPD